MWSAPSKHAPLSLLVVCTCAHALSVLACPLIVIGLLACGTTAQECAQGQREGGAGGGGAGATNSFQFKVLDVANVVPRRTGLMVMCLFTGFVQHGHHKITNLTLPSTA